MSTVTAEPDESTAATLDASPSGVRRWQALAGVLAVLLAVTLVLLVARWSVADEPGGVTRIGIALDEWEVVLPSHAVNAHTPLRFDVTNLGDLPHDLIIDGIAGTPLLESGETAQLDVGSLTPGVYRVYCGVVGHDAAGMVAELTVIDEHARAHEAHDH